MKFSYENINSVQLSDWAYEEKERENAAMPRSAHVKSRFKKKNGVWTGVSPTGTGEARLILAGDLLCHERLIRASRLEGEQEDYDFFPSFRYIRRILRGSDLAIANLESVIHPEAPYASEQSKIGRHSNRNAPPQFLGAIRRAGFDLLTTASNHMVDTGMRGLYRTNEYLDSYGFIHTGSFTDSEAQRFALVDVNGIRVGVLSYTMSINFRIQNMLTDDRRWMLNEYSPKRAEAEIAALRRAGADFILCYMHWGKEMVSTTVEAQRLAAQQLADFGADYIAGTHPHVIQPYEILHAADGRTVPVVYSMGNLISHFKNLEPKTSIMLQLDLTKEPDGTVSVEDSYLPCFAFSEFDNAKYVTMPLVNRVFHSESTNERAQERRLYAATILGRKIIPSHSFDLPVKEEEEQPFSLHDAVLNGSYLLHSTTKMQLSLLDTYRITDAFRKEYDACMLEKYSDCQAVQKAIEIANKYTGRDDICVETDWDLLIDLIYTKSILGFDCWEYFAYGLQDKTTEERLEFIPESAIMRHFRMYNTNAREVKVLNNKLLCYQRFQDLYKREIIRISGVEDVELFFDFCARHPQFITKPLAGSIGKDVLLIDTQTRAGLTELFHELLVTYILIGKQPFVCEELIHAHPSYAAIHPESVNSLRIFTYYDDIEPRVIVAWLKAGRGSAVIDNGSSGGLLAAIDCETGVVTTPARNEANETFETHPDTGFPFVGFHIDGWEKVVRIVKKAALRLDSVRIVGWDIALSEDKGWQIIEGNAYGMFNLLQVATRKGMRRQFLKDVEWDRYQNN